MLEINSPRSARASVIIHLPMWPSGAPTKRQVVDLFVSDATQFSCNKINSDNSWYNRYFL